MKCNLIFKGNSIIKGDPIFKDNLMAKGYLIFDINFRIHSESSHFFTGCLVALS